MVLKLYQVGRQSEALAYLPAAPRTTAFFERNTSTIGSFEKTFGVSLKDWLERMTVVSESCVIDKETQPPQTPAPGDVSGQHRRIPKPIAVNGEVLGAKLVELTERQCSVEPARVKLQLTGLPGLAATTVSGSAFILEDRRDIDWPTDPPPTAPGPAALVSIGGTAVDRISVPAPKWLVDAAQCAAQQSAYLEVQIAAVPGKTGLDTSIAANWRTPCADVVMRCRFRATEQEA
jgi:hypothetical protein